MDYKEYQKASYKHLVTCKSILNSISLLNGNPNAMILQNNKQQTVLHNIFYLSGYTLECIINYSILKHYKWKEPSIYTTDHNFSSRCGLAFYPNTYDKNGRNKYPFWLSQHEFSRNIQILQREFPNSKIPLIDRSEKVDAEIIKLFRAWCVETRYHNENETYNTVTLNINNIKLFVETTDKIYNDLLKIVG